MALLITKADGTREAFDNHKLLGSLARAGADRTTAHEISELVGEELFNGITTQEIYRFRRRGIRSPSRASA